MGIGLRAWVESSEGQREWGVYLINTIKKLFEGLIAYIRTTSGVAISCGNHLPKEGKQTRCMLSVWQVYGESVYGDFLKPPSSVADMVRSGLSVSCSALFDGGHSAG